MSKNAIITGGYGAIGKEIARQIATDQEFHVTIVGRNEALAASTVEDLIKLTGNKNIDHRITDLSSRVDIESLGKDLIDPVNVLVNNVAWSPRERTETSNGIEAQFATNVLSHLWMIEVFNEQLKAAKPARVVNVASYYAGHLDIEDLEFKKRPYDNNKAYMQSKQANRMLTIKLAEDLAASGITVNSCHPGDVNSKLSNDLGFGGTMSAADGAATPAWLAISPDVEGFTGRYFAEQQEAMDEFADDRDGIERLWEVCAKY